MSPYPPHHAISSPSLAKRKQEWLRQVTLNSFTSPVLGGAGCEQVRPAVHSLEELLMWEREK